MTTSTNDGSCCDSSKCQFKVRYILNDWKVIYKNIIQDGVPWPWYISQCHWRLAPIKDPAMILQHVHFKRNKLNDWMFIIKKLKIQDGCMWPSSVGQFHYLIVVHHHVNGEINILNNWMVIYKYNFKMATCDLEI